MWMRTASALLRLKTFNTSPVLGDILDKYGSIDLCFRLAPYTNTSSQLYNGLFLSNNSSNLVDNANVLFFGFEGHSVILRYGILGITELFEVFSILQASRIYNMRLNISKYGLFTCFMDGLLIKASDYSQGNTFQQLKSFTFAEMCPALTNRNFGFDFAILGGGSLPYGNYDYSKGYDEY